MHAGDFQRRLLLLLWSGGLCAVAPRPEPSLLLLVLYCSAYLVFMSADACLMECSFSLCVRFLVLWLMVI